MKGMMVTMKLARKIIAVIVMVAFLSSQVTSLSDVFGIKTLPVSAATNDIKTDASKSDKDKKEVSNANGTSSNTSDNSSNNTKDSSNKEKNSDESKSSSDAGSKATNSTTTSNTSNDFNNTKDVAKIDSSNKADTTPNTSPNGSNLLKAELFASTASIDQMVLTVQQWLNQTYGANPKFKSVFPNGVTESGKTGTEVEQALITALQIELGIATPTGTFGPATTSAFKPMTIRAANNITTPSNMEYILQGGFYCKGYSPGGFSGIFYTQTQNAVKQFQADAGLTNCDGVVTAMVMKALLNTDPFVLSYNGDAKIRQIQQNLNNKYNAYTGLLPTNGVYVAATNKALIYALQAEEGLSTSTANGAFGPTTTSSCPTLQPGDARTNFVKILEYALYCNGFDPGSFDGTYGSGVTSAIKSFQSLMRLPVTGIADMPTIKATLASCGDTNRSATAADCATILTNATATTLKNNGYNMIGRYLTGKANGISKALTASEIKIIFNNGLKFFPIYETSGTYLSYFTASQGITDAANAINASANLGLPSGTTIYFAVDFDAMDSDVTSNVMPYFQAISSYFGSHNSNGYKIGVYGARNVAARVYSAGYASNIFVCDMSTGFSGNLGYKIPTQWAFDQFTTVTIGSGTAGQLEIDKDSFSGNDPGVSYVVASSNTPQVYSDVPVMPSETKVADPVDSSAGSHVIEKNFLEVQGAQKFSFELNYNSSQLSTGAMGKGWYNNYEMRIEKQPDGSLYYYTYPSSYMTFAQSSTAGVYTTSTTGKKNWSITVNSDGTYLLNCGNNIKYGFDKYGALTKVQNKLGMVINVTYPNSSSMVITEPISEKAITVNYSNGFVSSITDSATRTVSFQYDNNMCLSEITDENGKTEKYTYDSAGHVLTGTDGDNEVYFTDTYDSSGKITSQDDGVSGNKLTYFSYDTTSVSGQTIVTVTDRNGNSYKNVFNSNKQLLSSTDQNGNTKKYTYDDNGNILTETDANGNVTTKTYDTNNNLLTSTDAVGSKTAFTYDSNNNMLSQKNPDGGTTQYTYDSNNRIVTSTDARGNITKYVYDTNGLPIEKDISDHKYTFTYQSGLVGTATDPQLGATTFTYDGAGHVATSTDAKGNKTTNSYDKKGKLLSKTDPNGGIVSYTYDSRGNLITQTDANGNKRTYVYNANNKVTAMTDEKGGVTTYTYDGEDREIQVKDAQGNITSTSYDIAGRVTSKTDANGNITKYTYDAVGNLLTTTKPSGGTITDTYYANNKLKTETDAAGNLNTYKYDTNWRLSSITDPLGNSTANTYDLQGNLLSEADKMGDVTTYTYDSYGNMLTKTDPNGNITTYTYDGNNKRTSIKDALGNMTTYAYDLAGLLKSATDANNNTVTYTYDADGRLTAQTDALGNVTSTLYDANGNTVKKTDSNGNSKTFAYDAANLLISSVDELGNKTSNTYDSMGNLTQVVDAMGNKTVSKYDAGGRLISVTDAMNGVSACQYTADGNTASLTGPAGGTTAYTYDASERMTSESTPSGGKISYTYNSLNLLSELTNARGQKRDYTYDAAGRIKSFTDTEGTTSYTYDKNGNVLTVTDAQGTISRQFDALNRVVKYTDVNKNVIQYSYDAVGNLSSITYPNGSKVSYAYDAGNHLSTVTDWANRITTYSYDKSGNLIKTVRPDGSILTEGYDAARRLTSMKDTDKSGNIINSYTYEYNGNGQITKEVSSNGQITSTMTYDALGRVMSRSDADSTGKATASYTYSYDAAGNITSGGGTMTYDKKNRLITYNGSAISYDDDGNMTNGIIKGSSTNFVYDSGNRLTQAGGAIYAYDALNNRISQTVNSKKTTYVYDGISSDLNRLLVSTDSTGNSTYYVYGIGLLGEESSSSYLVYHYDLRGSTTAITNMQQVVTDRYTYGAYGELLTHTGTAATSFLYNGRDGVMSDSNGLYYMRARYYSPELKRFINADTLKGSVSNGETLNNYAYANGNPISMVDPFGRCADMASDVGHSVLDTLGLIPFLGAVPDTANAVWYAFQGKWGYAGLSLACAIPFFGDFADAGKIAKDAVDIEKDTKSIYEIGEEVEIFSKGETKADFYVAPSGVTIKGSEWDFFKNTNNLKNMSKQQVIDSIPSGWEVKGRALYDKNNLYRARIDPPDNVTNYDHIHLYDYFNKKNNKLNILLDENFNRVPYNSPDGHIKIMP
jgi:RHS repeat-associated protein